MQPLGDQSTLLWWRHVRTCCGALALLCLCWGGPRPLHAQQVVAVLSSDLAPYRQAYEGFSAAFGQPVPVINLQTAYPRIGRDTQVIVAFGSKAALADYPPALPLVYCMAPSTQLDPQQRRGATIRINMVPQAGQLLTTLKDLQGTLHGLGVLWIVDTLTNYVDQLQEAGARLDIQIDAQRLGGTDQLPDALRRLSDRRVEALWLPPDPLLINANSFALVREFARANKIPLYAPTAGFVEEGSVASVGVSFAQNGQAAAAAVSQLLVGIQVPAEVYPQDSEISLNLGAAANAGLHFTPQQLARAHKVVP